MNPNIHLKLLILLSNLAIFSACSSSYAVNAKGMTVDEAYGSGAEIKDLKLLNVRSPLYQEKSIPVIYPPKVFGCYVPSHIDSDSDVLIGEHWIFFKISESSWFIENEDAKVEFETKIIEKPDKLIDVKLFAAENFKRGLIPVIKGGK